MRPPAELYDDVEFITQGGMARVYRARRKEPNRVVAVREIPGGPDGEQRIASERHGAEIQRALGAIDRRVPTVYDVSTSTEGWLYVEMELVEGEDLADKLQRGPLPVPDAVRIAREIFDFLRVAHGQAVVFDGVRREHQLHGDLTPRNVRIGRDDTVRILDFGIAKGLKATVTAQAFANYGYISPERARTGRMGLADDYWSAGVLLYEMLAGTRAFPGTPEDIRGALAARRPPLPLDPRIPRPLRLIVSKLLAWDPAFRYPSAEAVLQDFRSFEDGRKTQAEIEEDAGRTRPAPMPPALPGAATRPVIPAQPTGATPRRAAADPASAIPSTARMERRRQSRFPWLRATFAAIVVVVALHERGIWLDADARARIAATETVSPDRLWSDFERLRERAWLDMTTRRFGRIVAQRLTGQAVAALKDYREDLPTLRRGDFESARALLARAVRVDLSNATTEAWLRYVEGHIARIDGEAKDEDERRPALLQAVALFEDAASLAPHLPDPYIALARIYTYYIRDPGRARRALNMAERLGQPLGLRGHAQLGDLGRGEGDSLMELARELSGTHGEEPALLQARAELTTAVSEYDRARGFGQSARSARQAGAWIRSIDERLAELRDEATAGDPAFDTRDVQPEDQDSDSQTADAEPGDATSATGGQLSQVEPW